MDAPSLRHCGTSYAPCIFDMPTLLALIEAERIAERRTEERMAALIEERDVHRAAIAHYSSLLAPIRRLPEDTLLEIFRLLIGHRRNLISHSHPSVVVSHVCQHGA